MALCPPEEAVEEGQCSSCKATILQSYLLSQLNQKAELHKLIRSNEHPTNFQTSHCDGVISSAPLELERYDAEISRLRAVLEKLESERAVIEDYSRLCRYALSPIRRLPSEILTEIFTYFLSDTPEGRGPGISALKDEDAVEEELGCVANVNLLRISQVCPRWHQLIMGMPSLWSVITLNLCLWRGENRTRMMKVLESSLERGAHFPLDLGMQVGGLYDGSDDGLVPLHLVAQHSRRWRKVALGMDFTSPSKALSMVKDNLPLLESLRIEVGRDTSLSAVLELTSFFAVAPRLTELWYCGPPAALATLPLQQLQWLVYQDVVPRDLDAVISIMESFSDASSNCQIGVKIDGGDFLTALDLQSATSNVSVLELYAAGNFDADGARPMLSKFFTRLTLPFLDSLRIVYHQAQAVPLPWPHLEFLALSHRSSFSDHLITLRLESVFITETELLQTLAGLPLLQDLIISDHRVIDGQSEELVLVTNSLLQRLTWTPIPRAWFRTSSSLNAIRCLDSTTPSIATLCSRG
ncbi:hypothetical protein B0H13DRAFT_525075 [Mycena leptocephala]|nr:hypothetical protein B0H13DRAFT_525075 [Mycena leptocephala]